jgi:uncharacterized protein YcfJ
MRFSYIMLSGSLLVGLAGCMQTAEPMFSSRGSISTQESQSVISHENQIEAQTKALTDMTRDIVRKSTIKGAAIGAVAGCGLVLLSASNAKNCVTGALTGGAIGAIAGAAAGKKQTEKRVELVSPSALVRSISKADDKMDEVARDLPKMLAQQDTEIATLNTQMAGGEITSTQFAHRFEVIKANRVQLAEALSLSATQANEAHRNLQVAQSEGQTGLDWHLSATKNLARDVLSARSAISLL